VVEKTVISEKALKHALGRFGIPETRKALQWIVENLNPHSESESLSDQLDAREENPSNRRNKFLTRKIQIARVLFQDSSEVQGDLSALVSEINGVSEPATVPHQSPRAGDTPGEEFGKF